MNYDEVIKSQIAEEKTDNRIAALRWAYKKHDQLSDEIRKLTITMNKAVNDDDWHELIKSHFGQAIADEYEN